MPAVNAVPFAIGMAFPSGPSAAGNVSATIILSPFAAMLDNEVSSNGPLGQSIVETSDWSLLKAKAEVPLAIPAAPMGQGQSSKVAAAGDEALPETVVDVLTGSNPDDLRPVQAETILPEIAAAVVPIAPPLPGALVAASQPVDGGVPIALPRSTNARPAARPLKGGVDPSVNSDLATVALQPASRAVKNAVKDMPAVPAEGAAFLMIPASIGIEVRQPPALIAQTAPQQAPAQQMLAALMQDGAIDLQWLDTVIRDVSAAASKTGDVRFRVEPDLMGGIVIERTADRLEIGVAEARSLALIEAARPQILAGALALGVPISASTVVLDQSGSRQRDDARPKPQIEHRQAGEEDEPSSDKTGRYA